jgi:hypothetical protein
MMQRVKSRHLDPRAALTDAFTRACWRELDSAIISAGQARCAYAALDPQQTFSQDAKY